MEAYIAPVNTLRTRQHGDLDKSLPGRQSLQKLDQNTPQADELRAGMRAELLESQANNERHLGEASALRSRRNVIVPVVGRPGDPAEYGL